MVVALAGNTILNTVLAEVEVAIIASATVIMLIWDSGFTVVAVNGEDVDGRGSREAGVAADSILTLIIDASKLGEPSISGSGTTGDRNLGA